MIGHININSIRNKFEMLSNSIKGNLDILMISETKLDSTFPSNQFTIKGYAAPIRFDRNGRGGGISLYIREDIPATLLTTSWPKHLEGFLVQLNLRKKKTIETGLSDFRKLTLTVLKSHFLRLKPNIVNYRDYKVFVNNYFRSESLQEINSTDSDLKTLKIFNKHSKVY